MSVTIGIKCNHLFILHYIWWFHKEKKKTFLFTHRNAREENKS